MITNQSGLRPLMEMEDGGIKVAEKWQQSGAILRARFWMRWIIVMLDGKMFGTQTDAA